MTGAAAACRWMPAGSNELEKGFARLWIAVSLLCLPYPAYLLIDDVRDANDRYRVRMVHFNDEYGWADKPSSQRGRNFYLLLLRESHEEREKAKAECRRQEAWALQEWQDDWQRTVQQFLILGIGPP